MIALLTDILIGVALLMLLVAALLTLYRVTRGPSALDRVLATDVLVAVVVASVCVEEVVNDNATGLPVIMVLSVVGFTGSVAMARLLANVSGQQQRYRRAMTGDPDARARKGADR